MYPDTIYRVVAKAFITNEEGKILVVKESKDFWSFPGGGVDHGETPEIAIKREIQEELGIPYVLVGKIAQVKTVYLDKVDFWMTWVIYHATIDTADFTFGDGVKDARYIDVSELEPTEDILEKALIEAVHEIGVN